MCQWVANDLGSKGSRIDVPGSHPVMSSTTRLSCRSHSNRYSRAGSEGGHEFEYRSGSGKVADLLHVEPGVGVSLIHVCIAITLQVGEAQTGPIRPAPHLVHLIEFPTERTVDLLAA